MFNGTFGERKDDGLIKHSGLLVADFDNYPDAETMQAERERLKADKHTALLFTSPSGKGLKVVIRIIPTDKAGHIRAFNAYQSYIDSKYFDVSSKNVSRVCYMSHDPDIYLMQGCEVFQFKEEATIDFEQSTNEKVNTPNGKRVWPTKWDKSTLVGAFNEENINTVGEWLTQKGWSYLHDDKDGKQRWLRPNKEEDAGGSSATYGRFRGMFYVFSSNAEGFEPNVAYNPFEVYTNLFYNGDWKAAKDSIKPKKTHTPTKEVEEPEKPLSQIIDALPSMLKDPCNVFISDTEKEVFLVGALGVVSGLLPKYKAKYDGRLYTPNLFAYLLADYGSGKGGLSYARKLGERIHQEKRERHEDALKQYKKDLNRYKRQLRNKATKEEPEEPTKPPAEMLFIPTNNSKSGIQQLLQENDGKGIMFETEGDTLTDALKQDFGGFSDILRNAFHHEDVTMFRRTDNEYFEFKPELSIVLSSTMDQLKLLIPSAENGLFSRVIFYRLKQDLSFHNVFDSKKEDYTENIEQHSENYYNLYRALITQPKDILMRLTEEQQKEFVKHFSLMKADLIENSDASLNGTGNRIALIAFRVMMILTMLRTYEENTLNTEIFCKDEDFFNALDIIARFKVHALWVFHLLEVENDPIAKEFNKLTPDKREFMELLPPAFSTGEGLVIAENANISEAAYKRLLNKDEFFERKAHGSYERLY